MEVAQDPHIEEPPHWFDLGRIAWEPAFSVPVPQSEVVKPKDVKVKEEVDHKTQDPVIKCPMCGCNVK